MNQARRPQCWHQQRLGCAGDAIAGVIAYPRRMIVANSLAFVDHVDFLPGVVLTPLTARWCCRSGRPARRLKEKKSSGTSCMLPITKNR